MKSLSELDWSLIQSFLAVAETGSLSAAARLLGATQPTVGRHVQTLEGHLHVSLFNRQARGMVLTAQGGSLLEPARAMREAANTLSLTAAGEANDIDGTVRITASVFVSHYFLPPVVAELRESYPEIDLEIVASDASENLLFREADIAVRMYRPEQLDMVALHLGDVQLGLFASKEFIGRFGPATDVQALLAQPVVGYDRNETMIRGFRDAGFPVGRDFFPTRCDNQTVYWELVRAGCGMGFGPSQAGLVDPELEQIHIEGLEIPLLEMWLTAHTALRHTPRVDAVWRVLAKRFSATCDHPNPSVASARA